MRKNWLIIGIIILILGVFVGWLFIESSKPLPGEKVADLGREHVAVGTPLEYNSNPPTSGKHYDEWIRSGVYETPKEDGNLVHSLEHGYVIMSYNCDKKVTFKRHPKLDLGSILYRFRIKSGMTVKEVYAHGVEEEEEVNQSTTDATESAALPDSFRSEDCHKLVDQLIAIYEKKGKTRLIVIPRPNLDSRIALTAWNYIDKFNEFDQARIEKFIDAHLNQGPEKTMETAGE